jgi:hypothetical protein
MIVFQHYKVHRDEQNVLDFAALEDKFAMNTSME